MLSQHQFICRTLLILMALTSRIPAQAPLATSTPPPTLPYVAQNKCPFEGCVYREWTALKDMPVYDTWGDGRRRTGTLGKGEKVVALGGLVVTHRPGVIHVDRDIPEVGLKRGDSVLTYTYAGEGFSQVWVNGRFHEEFDISNAKWPDGTGCGGTHCGATYVDLGQNSWWAELRLKSGVTAWVDMEDFPFSGVSRMVE